MFQAINPANNKLLSSISFDDDKTIETKLLLANKAFEVWKKVTLKERIELMSSVSKILLSEKESYAQLMVEEVGKPIRAARAEIEKCAWLCDYYSSNAPRFLEDKLVETSAGKSYVSYQPLGTLLAVMPWNFPFWQVFRFAVPNIIGGNIILLKHAPSVPACTVAIDDIFFKAGFPEDVLVPLYTSHEKTEQIIANSVVKGITLTGSTEAGRTIAALAGKYLKKSVLELGGSDPFIVLADADLKNAAKICAESRLKNAGQSCIGAKRIIVDALVYDEFLRHFEKYFSNVRIGNPADEETEMGPLGRMDLRDNLQQQVERSVKAGAKCTLGGSIPEKEGAWYPPTILTEVKKGMPAFDEELFGPVASIIKARDEEDAIRIANDTDYGLGAAIFTKDMAKGEQIAKTKLNAGSCFVNEFVKSDPRLPFGGINDSGYGRELSSEGIYEFMNAKTIWLG